MHCVRRLRLQPRGCNHVPRYQEQRSHQIATISVHQIPGQYTRHGWVVQISSWNFLGVLLYTFPIISMSRVQSRSTPQFNINQMFYCILRCSRGAEMSLLLSLLTICWTIDLYPHWKASSHLSVIMTFASSSFFSDHSNICSHCWQWCRMASIFDVITVTCSGSFVLQVLAQFLGMQW